MSLPIYYLKSSEKFNHFDFKAEVLEYFKEHPCPLCGEMHPPEFHMFVKRSYIEDGKTIYIMVVRLICRINAPAKDKGRKSKKPYTITILPCFLIPYSRIPLDNVMNSVNACITGSETTQEKAAELMGVENIKSFIRYFHRAIKRLPKWINFLTREIISMDGTIKLPEVTNIKQYTRPLLSKWMAFRELSVQYMRLYLARPETRIIIQKTYDQFIHCRLAGSAMGLGP